MFSKYSLMSTISLEKPSYASYFTMATTAEGNLSPTLTDTGVVEKILAWNRHIIGVGRVSYLKRKSEFLSMMIKKQII